MVAVVSANGLGLFNSSLSQLGMSFGGQAGIGQSRESDWVNVANGNLVLQDLDTTIDVRGFEAQALRTYNSRGLVSGVGQDGFITGYERSVALNGTLNAAGSTLTWAAGDGQSVVFTYSGTANKYVSTAGGGANDTMTWSGTSHQWTYVEGSSQRQELYADPADPNLKGRLLRIRDLTSDGTTPAEFDVIYDANNRISEIRSVDGSSDPTQADAIIYGYDASGRLTSISTREAGVVIPRVTYTYDNLGRLQSVLTDLTPANASDNTWSTTSSANDGHLFKTTYAYVSSTDPNNLQILGVTTSDGINVAYTYDASGRVQTVSQGGQTVTFTYNAGSTDVTDAGGRTWTYQYDGSGQLTAVIEPAVGGFRAQTTYVYKPNGDLWRITKVPYAGQPATLDTIFEYDTNGNRTLQRDQAGNTVTWTYNSANQVLTETHYTGVDPDGLDPNETNALGAPAGAMTTNYVYDSQNRLAYVVDPLGDVSQYTYATSGTGIGQVSSLRRYLGATYNGALTYAAMNTWAGTGVKAASAYTTYTYDTKGRTAQVIAYATVNSAGSGVLDTGTAITNYVYDAQGHLLQQVQVHGSGRSATVTPSGSTVTDFVYDGLGRLLGTTTHDSAVSGASITDANSVQTTYAYLDSGNRIVVTFDSGLVQTTARNAAGEVVSVSQADAVTSPSTVTRTTQYFYDAAGLLRATQDAAGGITYFFYDADRRLTATVDATGAVTQTQFDGIGRVSGTTACAMRVNTSGWMSGGAVTKDTLVFQATAPGSLTGNQAWVQTDAANDRTTTIAYDIAGRLKTQTDPAGLVTCTAYDGANRITSVKVYKPTDATVVPRITYYYYDSESRQSAVVDAAGFMTETVYDLGGRVVQTIRYATPTTGGATMQRPAASANDKVCRYFYDGRDHLVGQLDYAGNDATGGTSNGYLTTYTYDETGNQRTVNAWATQLTGLDGTQSLATLTTAAAGSVRTTKRVFNALGQLASEVNFEGTYTYYSYDEAGRLVRTVVQDKATSPTTSREDDLRYDAFGEVIGEIHGEQAVSAMAAIGGQAINDPTLTAAQLATVWGGAYGTTNSYDADGRLAQSIDANGNRTWFFYDARGRQTTVVRGTAGAGVTANAFGEVTKIGYDAFGEVTCRIAYTSAQAITAPAGSAPTWSDWYASVQAMLATLSTGATDSRTTMAYDQRGLLVQATDAENAVSTFGYDAFGELAVENRWNGTSAAETVLHTWDQRGEELTRTEAAGTAIARMTSRTYDAFGRVASSTDALGLVTNFTYDRLGRQLSHYATVEGRTETWSATYDAYARVLTQTDAVGSTTSYQYSDSARSVTTTTAEGVVIKTVHDIYGATITVTTGFGTAFAATTTYAYDHDGSLKTVTNPVAGEVTTNAYDKLGHLLQTTDASGRIVAYTYDAVGRVLTRTLDPTGLNQKTTYNYDAQGRQVQVTDASGRITTTTYDRDSRVLSVALDPAGLNLCTNYTWDAAGHELTVVQGIVTGGVMAANATTTKYLYDPLGRRTDEFLDPSGVNLKTHYDYDLNDHLLARTDALGNLTRYVYDQAGELRYAIDPAGGVTEYRYDLDGHQTMGCTYATAIATSGLSNTTTAAQVAALVTTSATDQTTYRIYDRDGSLRYTVDGLGDVQETGYDAIGRAFAHYAYATPVTLSGADRTSLSAGTYLASSFGTDKSLNNQAPTTSAQYRVFDADNRVRYTIDALGDVTELRYDKSGRVVASFSYVDKIAMTPVVVNPLQAGTFTLAQVAAALPATAAANANVTYTIFDAAGRARFTVDALNQVRETRYDGAGRVVEQLAYLVPVGLSAANITSLAAGTYTAASFATRADLTNQSGTVNDAWTVYDTAGRVRFNVDALGEVSELRYDAGNRVVERLSYLTALVLSSSDKTALNAGIYAAATMAARTDLTNQEATAQVGYTVYDTAGRVRFTLDALGETTELRYDAAGRVVERLTYTTALVLSTSDKASLKAGTYSAATLAVRPDLTGQESAAMASWQVYDAAGRTRFSLDSLGDVSEYRYDAAGRTVAQFTYVVPLALAPADKAALAAGTFSIATLTADMAGQAATANAVYRVYDAAGRLRFQLDGLGDVKQMRYDGEGRMVEQIAYATSLTLSSGDLTALAAGTYDAASFATRPDLTVQEAAAIQSWSVYDAAGQLRYAVDAAGGVREWRYDGAGHLVAKLGYEAFVTVSAADRAALTAGALDPLTFFQHAINVQGQDQTTSLDWQVYDTAGRLRFRVDGQGEVNELRYDGAGHVVQQLGYVTPITLAQSDEDLLSSGTYGATTMAALNALTSQQATAHASYQVYDAAGHVRYTVTRAQVNGAIAGSVVENRYDASGRVTSQLRYAVTVAYDPTQTVSSLGGLITAAGGGTAANQRITRFVYDQAGRQRFVQGPDGAVTEQRFDAAGRVVATFAYGTRLALQSWTEATLAAAVAGITDNRKVSYGYDTAGRLLSTTDALNQTESYTYDGAGHRKTLTNKLGNIWTYDYDAAGRQTGIHTPLVAVLRYDANGNLLPPSNESVVTRIAYDGNGNVVSRTEAYGTPEARTTQYVYDTRGHQIQTIFPPAGSIDANGHWVAGGPATSVTVTYDALGRAVMERDVRGNLTFKVYDGEGRLAYDVDADGYITGYGYDALGEQTRVTRYATPADPAFIASYWNSNQPYDANGVNFVAPSPSDRTLTTTFDVAGNKQSVVQSLVTYTLADGTTAQGSPTTTFAYDAYGQRVTESVLLQNAAGSQPAIWATTHHYYDAMGRKAMDVDPLGYVTAWTYDAQGDVTQETQYARALSTSVLAALTTTTPPAAPAAGDAVVGYDRITKTTYDALGRKSTQTAASVHYQDTNGSAGVRDVVTTLGYDAIDEVTSSNSDGQVTTTTYDALGHATSVKQPQRSALVNGFDGLLSGTGGNAIGLGSTSLYETTSPYTTIAYDAFGNQLQVRRFANGWVQNQPPPVASASDQVQTTQYDGQGRAVITIDGEGNKLFKHYDAADNIIETDYRLDAGDGSWANVQTLMTYDGQGHQLTTTVWRTVHTLVNGVDTAAAAVTDQQAQIVYNAFGEIIAKGDPTTVAITFDNGYLPRYTYDNAGRLVNSIDHGGLGTAYGYNLAGYQITATTWHCVGDFVWYGVTGTDTQETTLRVNDLLGRAIGSTDPLHATVSQTLDRWGNAIEAVDALGNVTDMQYDAFNQVVDQKQPTVAVWYVDGTYQNLRPEVQWFYDALGRQVGAKDANGNVTHIGLDAAGEQVTSTDGVGNTTTLAYDALGQQRLQQNGMGYLTWQNHDRNGRLTAQGDYLPGTGTTGRSNATLQSFTLDENGDRIVVTDALHHATLYDFDSRNLLLRSQSAMGMVMNYRYDANGYKVLQEDGDTTHIGVMTWSYDVFGRVTGHHDLSNANYVYSYDGWTGELTEEVAEAGTGIVEYRAYDANGRIKAILGATGTGMATIYTYDLAGNRTSEETIVSEPFSFTPQTRYDVKTRTAYDSHNRIISVSQQDMNSLATTLTVSYTYDAQGNRRHLLATSPFASAAQDSWFSYDADNRMLVHDGDIINGSVQLANRPATSYQEVYDAAGHLVGSYNYGDITVNGSTQHDVKAITQYIVDLRGNTVATIAPRPLDATYSDVLQTQTFDADGHLTDTRTFYQVDSPVGTMVGAKLQQDVTYTYDADGRLLTEVASSCTTGSDHSQIWSLTNVNPDGTLVTAGNYQNASALSVASTISYAPDPTNHPGMLGYDAAGRAVGYSYVITNGASALYTMRYVGYDNWLQSEVDLNITSGSGTSTSNVITYDAWGRELTMSPAPIQGLPEGQTQKGKFFQYDYDGHILRRIDGTLDDRENLIADSAVTNVMYSNGEEIASVTVSTANNGAGTIDALSHVTGFENSQTGTAQVVVADGDTLQTLAQRVYGDSNLWYVLASANGLDANAVLSPGTTLDTPQVKTTTNDASTFKPYNPEDITGPNAPPMPLPSQGGCGVLGMIIMIIVAVVVTYLTAGAATAVFAEMAGEATAGTAASMAGAFVGGFVGNVASQGVGMAMGNVQHFSLKEAFASGLSAGLMQGLSGNLVEGTSSLTGEGSTIGNGLSSMGEGGAIIKGAMQAVEGTLTTYAANKIVGIKGAFSWTNVAASAITGAISSGVSGAITGKNGLDIGTGSAEGQFESGFVGGMVSGLVGAGVRKAIGIPGKFSLGQIAADAFGNALGDYIDGKDASQMKVVDPEKPGEIVVGRTPDGGFLYGDGTETHPRPDNPPVTVESLPPDDSNGGAGAGVSGTGSGTVAPFFGSTPTFSEMGAMLGASMFNDVGGGFRDSGSGSDIVSDSGTSAGAGPGAGKVSASRGQKIAFDQIFNLPPGAAGITGNGSRRPGDRLGFAGSSGDNGSTPEILGLMSDARNALETYLNLSNGIGVGVYRPDIIEAYKKATAASDSGPAIGVIAGLSHLLQPDAEPLDPRLQQVLVGKASDLTLDELYPTTKYEYEPGIADAGLSQRIALYGDKKDANGAFTGHEAAEVLAAKFIDGYGDGIGNDPDPLGTYLGHHMKILAPPAAPSFPNSYSFSGGAGLPFLFGVSRTFTITENWDLYETPISVGWGPSYPTVASFSATANWLDYQGVYATRHADDRRLDAFTSGFSSSAQTGVIFGFGKTVASNGETATSYGIMTPQAGVNGGYTFYMGNVLNPWDLAKHYFIPSTSKYPDGK